MATKAEAGKKTKSGQTFPVVGIGASAGGLGALSSFFQGIPDKTGMAYVVVVHLDPSHESHMAELLQRHTPMRVRQVSRAMRVEPNEVYVIPPDKDLTLDDGHFRLSTRAMPNRSRAPIDGFFRTLADTHSSSAFGIVLSGTGSDGAQGIRWIKEKGGVTMAQSPGEAEYKAMPENAIATGFVDIVGPVDRLGIEAVRIANGKLSRSPPGGSEAGEAADEAIDRILALIRSKAGHDFSDYKRSTLSRRIRRRAQFARLDSIDKYADLIDTNAGELEVLYNDLLISVTSFFRDPEAFAALETQVIPKLFENRPAGEAVRVWVTGCATGEEAYSISILLCENAERLLSPPPIQIFATDVHERGFAVAREGVYPESISVDVSPERLDRFFTRVPRGYKVKKAVRDNVIFATQNLLRDPPFLRLDLISCRNLMIYVDRDAQKRILKLFNFCLRPGGSLFLGTSESIEEVSKYFSVGDKKNRIFVTKAPSVAQASIGGGKALPTRAPKRKPRAPARNHLPLASIHRIVLEELAPPSVMINRDGEVIHRSESVGRFLNIGGGEQTGKLLDMLPRQVRPKVRKLIANAFVSGKAAELQDVMILVGPEHLAVNITIQPLPSHGSADAFALVVFDDHRKSRSSTPEPAAGRRKTRASTVHDLETELKETRDQLHVTIEEHEATIEEAKAANEELQSINEEQRATEEELEASKEELQSINEELQTLNQEYRNKNEQLNELNADLVNLINSTEIATIFLDRQMRVRRFTPAISALFNLLPTDAGRPLTDLSHRLEYPLMLDDAREVMRSLYRIDREVPASDGRWYATQIAPYRSLEDRIDGVVITFVDITERKNIEVERESLLSEAQATSIAKSNFIGVMSHELRTPLNAILGYADILMAGAVGTISPDQAKHLDRIKTSAAHLAHMIDDSLQSVRIEAGITSLNNEIVDVGALVREVAAATRPLMSAKSLRFEANIENGSTIVADPTRIRQILFNLLGNAVRYTDTGTVSISSRVDEHGAVISIEDTGIGISQEHLSRIFERFWQVDQSKTRLRGGAGLGLMVSRSLARLMGGELEVSSEIGKGSRFIVRLPLGDKESLRP